MKEENKKKKTITSVEFAREAGVQVNYPTGSFIKRIVKDQPQQQSLKQFENDYKKLGIKEVQMNAIGIVIVFESAKERYFPYSQIASFTVEEV